MLPTKKERIKKLRLLLQKGKLSPELKTATKNLIIAMEKGNTEKVGEISWLHQYIVGTMDSQEKYREDDDVNMQVAKTTAYREFDAISHGMW